MTTSNKKSPNWLTKDYKLPKLNVKKLLWAVAFLLIPNLFFLVGAYFIGLSRPLINVDYVMACVLFAMPHRFFKMLGTLAFVMAVFIDVAMLAMQLFPFLNINTALSLAPFLINAPLRYIILSALVLLYMGVMPLVMIKISNKIFISKKDWVYALLVAIIGFWTYDNFNHMRYVDRGGERFAQSDHFVIHSQYKRYRWVADSEFVSHFNKTPILAPLKSDIQNASHYLNNSSNKTLLIVAESWGVARKESVTDDMLANIYAQQGNFDFIERGYFDFSGATVEGELRELCQLGVHGGYAFSKVGDEFKGCLPHRFANLGHHTIGMHAGFSQIYERDFLYPKMGFKETIFAEQHSDKKRCSAFNGICDGEMFGVVAEQFAKHDKLFFYWLTLTSHSSYPKKDIHNHRLDCRKYELPDGDICNNFMLHTQFFDDLSELIKRPEMAGVEVVVVGDHMPPLMMREPIHPHIHWQRVSWLHFKIKEKTTL